MSEDATPVSEKLEGLQEIGRDAVWTVSSAKSGSGVDQVFDGDLSTFWQSDGLQPHYLTIQFPSRCRVAVIALYVRFQHDQSYTPHKVSVRVGTTWNDVEEVKSLEMESPEGWQFVDIRNADGDCVFASMVQLVVHSNHHQGRDSHLRCLKIYGPAPQRTHALHKMSLIR